VPEAGENPIRRSGRKVEQSGGPNNCVFQLI